MSLKECGKQEKTIREKQNDIAVQNKDKSDETTMFEYISTIIESRRLRAQAQANQESVLMFWEIGKYIGSILLGGERAGYGKQIVVTLSQ
jgi:hypothetical protein